MRSQKNENENKTDKPPRRLAVLDLETDPFEFGIVPRPFCAGFYDGSVFASIWNDDCVSLLVEDLKRRPDPLIIFAHNGGKFDYFYFLEYLEASDLRIINGRIIQAYLFQHELRDSYAIMPFPLRDFEKDKIDYNKMKRNVREKHKDEIISYLKTDCVSLHTLVTAFFAEFGDKLTVGSSSMKQLQRFHKFDRGKENFDASFRTDFYFGGRNQVFHSGIVRRPLKIYDVNSMYPHVMKSYLHPVGTIPILSTRIEHNTCFVVTTGHNYGAFPVRSKNGSLDFTIPYGKFSTTIHEFMAALETGCFKPDKIHKTYGFDKRQTFAEFVDHFYNARAAAKLAGDKIHTLFYKYVLNSAYGKFAQNPDNFFEWCLTPGDETVTEKCPRCPPGSVDPVCTYCQGSGFRWTPAYIHQGKYTIWQAPLLNHFFYNVTTGASITGAARAELMHGIAGAVNPIYCDTDSVICEDLKGVRLNDAILGGWKLEGSGDIAAICGKKLYAVFARSGHCVDCEAHNHDPKVHTGNRPQLFTIKKAHKGARLTGSDILRIASGETVEASNPVPAFKLDGSHFSDDPKVIKKLFTIRNIRRTGAQNIAGFRP